MCNRHGERVNAMEKELQWWNFKGLDGHSALRCFLVCWSFSWSLIWHVWQTEFSFSGSFCSKLSVYMIFFGCSFIIQFLNGMAILHHSKSPFRRFRGNSLLPSGRPSSLGSSLFPLMGFSSVLPSIFVFLSELLLFFSSKTFVLLSVL